MKSDAERYITPTRWCRHQLVEHILRSHDVAEGMAVCEVGCGAGDFLKLIADRGYTCTGVDISPSAVDAARKNTAEKGIAILHGEIQDCPGDFDLIFCFNVIEHIKNDYLFLEKITDKLRDGGHLLLTCPAQRKIFGAMDEYYGHFRRYDPSDIHDRFDGLSMDVIHHWSYGFNWVQKLGAWLFIFQIKSLERTDRQRQTEKSGMVKTPLLWKILYRFAKPFYSVMTKWQFQRRVAIEGANFMIFAQKIRK